MIDMNEEAPSDMSSGIPGMIYTLRQYYDKALAEMSAVDQISRAANTSARTWKRKKVDPAYENALTAISAGSGNVEMQAGDMISNINGVQASAAANVAEDAVGTSSAVNQSLGAAQTIAQTGAGHGSSLGEAKESVSEGQLFPKH